MMNAKAIKKYINPIFKLSRFNCQSHLLYSSFSSHVDNDQKIIIIAQRNNNTTGIVVIMSNILADIICLFYTSVFFQSRRIFL